MPMCGRFVTAGEQGALSAQGDRTDGIFDRVCVHLESNHAPKAAVLVWPAFSAGSDDLA